MIWPGIASSQQPGEIPPISCVETFVDDYAAAFGGLPATIVGQNLSAENVATPGFPNYIATSEISAAKPLWETGVRVVQMQNLAITTSTPGETARVNIIMTSAGGTIGVAATFDAAQGLWIFSIQEPIGTPAATAITVAGTTADVPAIGIGSDGTCYAWLVQSDIRSAQLFGPEANEFFTGSSVALAGTLTLEEGKSAAFDFITFIDEFIGDFSDSQDWCSNEAP